MWIARRSGKNYQRSTLDHRLPYERDRTRVIHCPAFRRLQGKTQILGTNNGDFHRTRLTHSLEVASIGQSIVRNFASQSKFKAYYSLLPNDDLINTICLLHDIGHPPFGHGGEAALNYFMRYHGGFESNGQTLRLITKLESSYGNFGLDLTRRTLLGILKYPVSYHKLCSDVQYNWQDANLSTWPLLKAYLDSEKSVVQWILEPFSEGDQELFQTVSCKKASYHNFDCSIMDIADDIAYGVHDLEDAIHLGLVSREQLDDLDFHQLLTDAQVTGNRHAFLDKLFNQDLAKRKQAIGVLVNYFITHTDISITNPLFIDVIFRYNVTLNQNAYPLLQYLKQQVSRYVIYSQTAKIAEYRGQQIISRLFEIISTNPLTLLAKEHQLAFTSAVDESSKFRIVCDYLANMSDGYAHQLHQQLLGLSTVSLSF